MDNRVEWFIAHELAYNFLSKVFYEPPKKQLIDTLAADDLFDAWPLETNQAEVETGLALLRGFCASWNGDVTLLEQDYNSLFVGPGRLLAPPWESVYRGPDHMLFDVHTLQVRHEYQSFGMPIPHLYSEPEDHLGLEFRFITHLCQLGLGALDQNQPDVLDAVTGEIRTFLGEHLLKWASPCLGLVIENAKSDYYRGCAHLALGCLAHTSETMELEAAR